MKKINAKKGFTLPEILVAASIMISLFALISATLWDYSKISVKAQIELRIQEKLRNAMKKLDKELLFARAVLPYYKIGTNGSGESIPNLNKCFSSTATASIASITPGTAPCNDGAVIRTSANEGVLILSVPVYDQTDNGYPRERYNRFNPKTNTVVVLYKTTRYGREQLRMARYPAISKGFSIDPTISPPSLNSHSKVYSKATSFPAEQYYVSSTSETYPAKYPYKDMNNNEVWREKPKVVSDIVFDYLSPRKPAKSSLTGKEYLKVKKYVSGFAPDGTTPISGNGYDIFTVFRDPLSTDNSSSVNENEASGIIRNNLLGPAVPSQQYLSSPPLSISEIYNSASLMGYTSNYNQAGAVVGFKIELWGAEDYGDGYVARSRDNYVRLDFTGEGNR